MARKQYAQRSFIDALNERISIGDQVDLSKYDRKVGEQYARRGLVGPKKPPESVNLAHHRRAPAPEETKPAGPDEGGPGGGEE